MRCCSWGNSGIITGVAVAAWWPVCCAWCRAAVTIHHYLCPQKTAAAAAGALQLTTLISRFEFLMRSQTPAGYCPVPSAQCPGAQTLMLMLQHVSCSRSSFDHAITQMNILLDNIHITILTRSTRPIDAKLWKELCLWIMFNIKISLYQTPTHQRSKYVIQIDQTC